MLKHRQHLTKLSIQSLHASLISFNIMAAETSINIAFQMTILNLLIMQWISVWQYKFCAKNKTFYFSTNIDNSTELGKQTVIMHTFLFLKSLWISLDIFVSWLLYLYLDLWHGIKSCQSINFALFQNFGYGNLHCMHNIVCLLVNQIKILWVLL